MTVETEPAPDRKASRGACRGSRWGEGPEDSSLIASPRTAQIQRTPHGNCAPRETAVRRERSSSNVGEPAAGSAVGVGDEHRPARLDRGLQSRSQCGCDRVGAVVEIGRQVLDVGDHASGPPAAGTARADHQPARHARARACEGTSDRSRRSTGPNDAFAVSTADRRIRGSTRRHRSMRQTPR